MTRFGLLLALLGVAACEGRPEGEGRTPAPASPNAAKAGGAGTSAPGAGTRAPGTPPTAQGREPDDAAATREAAARRLTELGEASGSCNWISVVSSCTEAVGKTPKARESALRALGQVCKSVPQQKPCPAERRIGSCRTLDGFVEHYYAGGGRPYTVEEAKAECENRDGRWLG